MSKVEEVERNALKIIEDIVINYSFFEQHFFERLCAFAENEFLFNFFYSYKCIHGCKKIIIKKKLRIPVHTCGLFIRRETNVRPCLWGEDFPRKDHVSHNPGYYFHMLTSVDTCGDCSRPENTQTSGSDKSE